MTCTGGIRFLPSFPISVSFDFSSMLGSANATIFCNLSVPEIESIGVAEVFLSLYKQRLMCVCPGLTDDEFNRLLHPLFGADMVFNIMQGPDADLTLSSCPWAVFDNANMRANVFNRLKIDLAGRNELKEILQ